MSNKEDILVFQLIQKDHESALKYLFNKYFKALSRYVNFYIKNHLESEEIALDIFIYIWENRQTIRIETSFEAYLFKMARNRSLNNIRTKKREIETLNQFDVEIPYSDENNIELQELEALIVEAINGLPDRCKEIFEKSREESMTNKEIASQMQISIKTVEAHIAKALKNIKKHLDNYHYLFLFFF